MIINPKAKVVEYKSECIGKVPLISVVVITYNHQQYIEKCIDNIINQKINSDFEIILGEDDSEDNTRKICINYAKKYSDKVRLFLHNADNKIYFNGEPTGRFNLIYSLSQCRGKYIFFCEGDDYWTDPNKLQKQVDFLEANPTYAGCYHDTLVKYTNHEKPDHLFREELPQSMNVEDTLATLSPFHTSSFMFKKDSFSFEPFLTKVKSGDMAIFSIVASRGLLGKVDGIMSVYIKHESGVTNSFNHNHDFHQHRIELLNFLNEFHEYKFEKKVQKVIQIHQQRQASIMSPRTKTKRIKKWVIEQKKKIIFILRKSFLLKR